MDMSIKEYEDKIRGLEFQNRTLENSREKGWLLVGELQIKNERLEKENADLWKEVGEHYLERLILERKIKRMAGEPTKEPAPKYYAKMSISKRV